MAFSNVWDTTFPPDTQVANLLGQDIRNGVKVDVQQRMAAISGLDAAKPNFVGDAQPANWVGILFFATDTGRIYQFNNPSWTDVTANFLLANSPGTFRGNFGAHTGTTTLDTLVTLTIPGGLVPSNAGFRVVLDFGFNNFVAGTDTWHIKLGGQDIIIPITGHGPGGPQVLVQVYGYEIGTNQKWYGYSTTWQGASGQSPKSLEDFTAGPRGTTVNMAVSQNLIVQVQSGNAGNSQTGGNVLFEIV